MPIRNVYDAKKYRNREGGFENGKLSPNSFAINAPNIKNKHD